MTLKKDSGSVPTAQQELPAPVSHQSLDCSPSMEEIAAMLGLPCMHDGSIGCGGNTAIENDNTTVIIPSDTESSVEPPEGLSIAERVNFLMCKNLSAIPENSAIEYS
eukprot:3041062-Ditylum_brightwellii.AAC.1